MTTIYKNSGWWSYFDTNVKLGVICSFVSLSGLLIPLFYFSYTEMRKILTQLNNSKPTKFWTPHLAISGYSPVKIQKLERAGNVCLKVKSLLDLLFIILWLTFVPWLECVTECLGLAGHIWMWWTCCRGILPCTPVPECTGLNF